MITESFVAIADSRFTFVAGRTPCWMAHGRMSNETKQGPWRPIGEAFTGTTSSPDRGVRTLRLVRVQSSATLQAYQKLTENCQSIPIVRLHPLACAEWSLPSLHQACHPLSSLSAPFLLHTSLMQKAQGFPPQEPIVGKLDKKLDL